MSSSSSLARVVIDAFAMAQKVIVHALARSSVICSNIFRATFCTLFRVPGVDITLTYVS